MRCLTDFAILHEYERIKKLGDKLVEIGSRIKWEEFRPKLDAMFKNNTERGGRPNVDVILMLKSLFIQQLYAYLMSSLNGISRSNLLECSLAQQRSFQIPTI
jgi:IS5 family transposase